jgi:hypothetical protein
VVVGVLLRQQRSGSKLNRVIQRHLDITSASNGSHTNCLGPQGGEVFVEIELLSSGWRHSGVFTFVTNATPDRIVGKGL